MPDIIKERLELIVEHAAVILERMQSVSDASELKDTRSGQLLFDSLITRLQALAEHIKKIKSLIPHFLQPRFRLMLRQLFAFAILPPTITKP